MRWKDFLYFQRGSKTAVILLLILIVLTFVLNLLLSYKNSSDIILIQNDSIAREFEEFRQALRWKDSSVVVAAGESREFEEYGSRAKRFASHHGDSDVSQRYSSRNDHVSSSRIAYPSIEKLSKGETISLNASDTTEWKKVPGIGSVYAARIVKYQNLLGGFSQVEQLLEVYGIDQELFSCIAVYIEADGDFRRLQVNEADFKELLSHPYLNYKQVQAIMNIRRRKGDIISIRELSMLDEFTAEDILRIEPYLKF
ncbi:MAG: helix-hairpin-helix domain-containing protein [Proteiniphilum sp.]